MKRQLLTGVLAAATLVSGIALQAPEAKAAAVACSQFADFGLRLDPSNLVIPNNGCAIGSYSQDSAANVNADGIFGFSDWNLLAKSDEPSGSDLFNPVKGKEGTFDFTRLGFDFSKDRILVTFKGANEFKYVGYLLTASTGTWSSPFTDRVDRIRDVSHISVFKSATPVPTPALLPGLIGMGVAALRKRKGEAEESTEA